MTYQDPQSPRLQERFNRAISPGQSNRLEPFQDLRVPNSRLQPFPSPSLALEEFGLNLVLPSPPASPPLAAFEGDDFDDELELTRTVTAIYSPIPDDASAQVEPPAQKSPPTRLWVPPSSPLGAEDPSSSQCSTPRPQDTLPISLPQSPRLAESPNARRGAVSAPCTTCSGHAPIGMGSPQLWTAELAVRTKLPRTTVAPLLTGVGKSSVENVSLLSPVYEAGDSMAGISRVELAREG